MSAENLAQSLWIRHWQMRARYHRYEVDGLDILDRHHPALIVGYHGRPLAYDMCMLTVKLHERYGYLPHGIVHRGLNVHPKLQALVGALGFVTDDGPEIIEAVQRGEHIVTTPGGGREAMRSMAEEHRVAWGHATGYIKLAIRHGLPIVPVAASGADRAYLGLWNAEALATKLRLPKLWSFAAWAGIGPLGPYPVSPPWPVKMKQRIGEPLVVPPTDPKDKEAMYDVIQRTHEQVTRQLQAMLDDLNGRKPPRVRRA